MGGREAAKSPAGSRLLGCGHSGLTHGCYSPPTHPPKPSSPHQSCWCLSMLQGRSCVRSRRDGEQRGRCPHVSWWIWSHQIEPPGWAPPHPCEGLCSPKSQRGKEELRVLQEGMLLIPSSPGLGQEKSGQPQGESEPWACPERSQGSVPSLPSLVPTCSSEAWASS